MVDRLRAVLVIMEEGSVSRAAVRLRLSQPTLTRQLQALEQELGAPLFERGPWGVRPTDLAHRLRESMGPVIAAYDRAWADLSARAHGRQTQIRVGYLGLSAARFLTPVLGEFQQAHPGIRLWLLDQTPREQLKALRAGDLDLALIGQEGAALGNEFYRQRVARIGVVAILPSGHALAGRKSVSLRELAGEPFVLPAESAVPGRRQWAAELCRKAGFRLRSSGETGSVTDTFARVAGERAVSLLPDYLEATPPPGVSLVRLSDRFATWEFSLLRQRGRMAPACRDLIRLIAEAAKTPGQHREA
jgi:DNA-binding transcriptional LysR family regulator